mgnify:FL=1
MTEVCFRIQNGTSQPEDELLLATLQLRLAGASELRQQMRAVADTSLTLSERSIEDLPE